MMNLQQLTPDESALLAAIYRDPQLREKVAEILKSEDKDHQAAVHRRGRGA